jgi:hypothetical protein
MTTKRAAAIYPTVDEINALPEKFRQYIHDLETRCDKSGDVQTIAYCARIEMHCSGASRRSNRAFRSSPYSTVALSRLPDVHPFVGINPDLR